MIRMKKNLFRPMRVGDWGFHVKSTSFFKKNIVVTYSLLSWLQGSFRFTYLLAKLMEKWPKALHSDLEVHWLKPRLSVTLGSNKYQTVIKMGLVTLPLDSGPKLAMGQWIAWWSGLPAGSSSKGKLCVLSACYIGWVEFWSYQMGASHKGMGPFLLGKSTPQDTM